MQPKEMPDMQCTMLVKKPTRRSTRILTPSLQKSTALLTSLEERTLMLLVTNLWRMMQERCQWAKTQSRRPGWSTTKGFSMLSLTGTQTICHINHQWKARPSQSPLIWLRSYLADEGRQSTGPIRHSGGDDKSGRWHGCLHDPWPRSCNHSWWQGTLWLGAEFYYLPLQGKRGRIGKGQLLRSQADRAGYENPREDCGLWCQSTIPSLALSQAEALQTQSLLSGSCKRSI